MANDRLQLQLLISAAGAQRTAAELRAIREEIEKNSQAARDGNQEQAQGNNLLGGGIAELAFRYNNVVGALQNLRATAQPVYDALIASNERLNAQILSSQTNLASSTRIFKGGEEIVDPTEKILASAPKLRAAIKQIEIDTQSLVGVTSSQVNELFQITLTNAGALNNQSKQFPDAISAATQLTKGWAASLKVVGIPLNQARQEINSIVKGQITQDSLLAKNLNLTNQQVESYRSQGTLVDELNKRLEVFVAGNGIAARSIEGISSNILDLSERITRNIGEPFLEPTINALAEVEKYLKSSEEAITGFFAQLADEVIRQGGTIAEAFAPLGKTLLEIGADLGPIALSAIKGILSALAGVAQVVAPLANLLAGAAKVLTDFASTDLGGIVVQTAAIVLVLTQLSAIIAGLAAAALPALSAAVLGAVSNMLLFAGSTTGVATASTLASAAVGVYSGALKLLAAEAIALNFALIPLVAALGLAVLVRTSRDLEDANNALDEYGKQVLTTADAVLGISDELNRYNRIVKEGGKLTEEQVSRQKQLKAVAQAQVSGIQDQIKAQKELTGLNENQARLREGYIKQLEALAEKADKAAGGLRTESKLLKDLGTIAEAFATKMENAKRIIKNEGGGVADDFEKAAKLVIDLSQKRVAAKNITVEAAREELEAIKSNTKLEVETRISAKDAIDKLIDGRIAKIKELLEVGSLEVNSAQDELAKIRDDSTLEAGTRRKAGQQIVAVRKEQIQAEVAAMTAGQSQIAALQSQQRLGEAASDEETTRLKVAEINKRVEAGKVALQNATSDTERARLKAEAQKDAAELEKLDADLSGRQRKRAIEDFDERRNLLKAQNDLGLIDRATYNQQIANNDLAQNDAALAQQRTALALLQADDIEGREAVSSQIAVLQSKRIEIAKIFDQADLKRQTEFYDQELTALESFKSQRLISEEEFTQQKAQNRIAQTDAEIAVATRELKRLGANDIEGRNAVNAKINVLSGKRLKALEESYAAELILIKNAAEKALAIVNQSEQQRSIDLQQLVNDRLVTQEVADEERSRSILSNQKAELQSARAFEAALARTATAQRSPEVERAYQQQVREARAKTLAATLTVIQTEGQELGRLRTLALKGVEDTTAARTRAADLQLSQINQIRGERERSTKEAEAGAGREVNAIEIASKAIERQSLLLAARDNLSKATSDADISKGSIDIERLSQALVIRKELEAGIIPYAEYMVKIARLEALGVTSSESALSIQQRKLELERQQSGARLDALNLEQTSARASLTIDQLKNDLANQRLLIEAKIAEFKAKQGVLDAESNALAAEQNSRKSLDAANLAITQAKSQQPGRERDRSIADAQAKLVISRAEADTNQKNAEQGIELAKQQADFATKNTAAATKQIESSNEIKRLQTETLTIQQNTVLEQFKQVEAAKLYANELERAKAAAEAISKTTQSQTISSKDGVQTLPARARGGSVQARKPYLVGENSAEVFVPNVSGVILNKEQLLANFGNLGGLNMTDNSSGKVNNQAVVDAVRSLEQTIQARPPTPIVANFNATDDGQLDKMFAIQRSALRV